MGPAILACAGLFHLSPIGVGNELCSVADAQHGIFADKLTEVGLECLRVVDTVRRTTENDTYHVGVVLRELVVRKNLTKGVEFAHTATNELGCL